jgi:hypothetical protein
MEITGQDRINSYSTSLDLKRNFYNTGNNIREEIKSQRDQDLNNFQIPLQNEKGNIPHRFTIQIQRKENNDDEYIQTEGSFYSERNSIEESKNTLSKIQQINISRLDMSNTSFLSNEKFQNAENEELKKDFNPMNDHRIMFNKTDYFKNSKHNYLHNSIKIPLNSFKSKPRNNNFVDVKKIYHGRSNSNIEDVDLNYFNSAGVRNKKEDKNYNIYYPFKKYPETSRVHKGTVELGHNRVSSLNFNSSVKNTNAIINPQNKAYTMKYFSYFRRQIILIQNHWRKFKNRRTMSKKKFKSAAKIQSYWRGHTLRYKLYIILTRYYKGRAFVDHLRRIRRLNRWHKANWGFQNLKNHQNSKIKQNFETFNKEEKLVENFSNLKPQQKIPIFENDLNNSSQKSVDLFIEGIHSTKKYINIYENENFVKEIKKSSSLLLIFTKLNFSFKNFVFKKYFSIWVKNFNFDKNINNEISPLTLEKKLGSKLIINLFKKIYTKRLSTSLYKWNKKSTNLKSCDIHGKSSIRRLILENSRKMRLLLLSRSFKKWQMKSKEISEAQVKRKLTDNLYKKVLDKILKKNIIEILTIKFLKWKKITSDLKRNLIYTIVFNKVKFKIYSS